LGLRSVVTGGPPAAHARGPHSPGSPRCGFRSSRSWSPLSRESSLRIPLLTLVVPTLPGVLVADSAPHAPGRIRTPRPLRSVACLRLGMFSVTSARRTSRIIAPAASSIPGAGGRARSSGSRGRSGCTPASRTRRRPRRPHAPTSPSCAGARTGAGLPIPNSLRFRAGTTQEPHEPRSKGRLAHQGRPPPTAAAAAPACPPGSGGTRPRRAAPARPSPARGGRRGRAGPPPTRCPRSPRSG